MEELIKAYASLFEEFKWRRFLAVLCFLALGFSCVAIYEGYTASFRLSRLQHSAELLVKLHEMEGVVTNGSPEIQTAAHAIVEQTVSTIRSGPMSVQLLPGTLKFSTNYFWKFLAGASLWFGFGLLKSWKALRSDKSESISASLAFSVGILAGLAGIAIPPFWWPWFHLVIYPLAIMASLFLFVWMPLMLWWCSPFKPPKDQPKSTDDGAKTN